MERLGSLDDLDGEIERRRRAEPDNLYAWLPLMFARGLFSGRALLGPSENAKYPEVRPESLADAIARGAF